jgi:HAE1 family hydrophobic/amphiphilic exporter-1
MLMKKVEVPSAMLHQILKNRSQLLWITLFICLIGLGIAMKMPVRLLPKSELVPFIIQVYFRAGVPEEHLKDLQDKVHNIIKETTDYSSLVSKSTENLVEFQFNVRNPDIRLERKLDLATSQIVKRDSEIYAVHSYRRDEHMLPVMEILITQREGHTEEAFEQEVRELIDKLENAQEIMRAVSHGLSKEHIQSTQNHFHLNWQKVSHDGYGKSLREESEVLVGRSLSIGPGGTAVYWSAEKIKPKVQSLETQEEKQDTVWLDGVPSVSLILFRSPRFDEISMSQSTRRILESFQFGHGNYQIIKDTSDYIQEAERNVASNLLMGTILTCVCILLFLRRFWSTLLVSLAIPVSLLLSIPILYLLDISRNVMSLAGVALGVGIVVDASLTTVTSFNQRMIRGFLPSLAAQYAIRDNQTPLLLTSLTTLAVFLPILTLDGLVG